jgi:hypothetical protein
MPLDEQPTVEYVEKLAKHLEGLWSRTHAKWMQIDSYYNQTFQIWPAGLNRPEWLKPSRSRSIVDHATDHQLAHDPVVHRMPAAEGVMHKRRADKVEPALKAIMDEASLLEPSLTWKQVGKHLLLYGYAIVEDGLDGNVLHDRDDKPRKGRDETEDDYKARQRLAAAKAEMMMPFRTRAPHPARVLLDPTEKDPKVAIKHTYRYSKDLEDMTKARMTANGKPKRGSVTKWECGDEPFSLIETYEYWSDCWHAMVADNNMLFVEKNTWGFVPYSHAYAGYGQEVTSYTEVDPSYMAVGILEPVLPVLKAQAQAVAGRHNALMEATFNPTGTTMDAAELQEQLSTGDVIEMGNRGDVWKMEIPQLPRWMFQSEEWLDKDIEMGTFARALAGVREQGVSTVGQQAILSTAAGRKFASPARQLEHLASRSASHVLQLIDVMGLRLNVRGNKISPQDIEHNYSVKVSFELVDPVLQLQNRELGMREVQQGLKSKETYWSADARLEDATGERRRLLEDLIRTDPEVQRLLAGEVLREAGLLQAIEAARAEEEAMAAAAQGGGGVPGGGGGPAMAPEEPPVLGPDGMPLNQTMGGGGLRPLREPLTPGIAKPSRIGASRA